MKTWTLLTKPTFILLLQQVSQCHKKGENTIWRQNEAFLVEKWSSAIQSQENFESIIKTRQERKRKREGCFVTVFSTLSEVLIFRVIIAVAYIFLRNSKPEILNWNCCFGHDSVKVGNTASLSSKLDEKEDGGVDFLPGVQKRVDYHFLGDEIQVLRHSVKKLFSCLRNFKWVVQFQTLFQQSPMVVLHSFRFTVIINYFAKLILIQHIWRKICLFLNILF